MTEEERWNEGDIIRWKYRLAILNITYNPPPSPGMAIYNTTEPIRMAIEGQIDFK